MSWGVPEIVNSEPQVIKLEGDQMAASARFTKPLSLAKLIMSSLAVVAILATWQPHPLAFITISLAGAGLILSLLALRGVRVAISFRFVSVVFASLALFVASVEFGSAFIR